MLTSGACGCAASGEGVVVGLVVFGGLCARGVVVGGVTVGVAAFVSGGIAGLRTFAEVSGCSLSSSAAMCALLSLSPYRYPVINALTAATETNMKMIAETTIGTRKIIHVAMALDERLVNNKTNQIAIPKVQAVGRT